MKEVFYKELKDRIDEIIANPQKDDAYILYQTYLRIMFLSIVSRKEGLLSLEEVSLHLDITEVGNLAVLLIVDGTDNHTLQEILMNKVMAVHNKGTLGLSDLMYYASASMIQCGDTLPLIEKALKSFIPYTCKDEFESYLPDDILETYSRSKINATDLYTGL